MRVGLFITCVNDTLYPGTGQAVVSLLERLGVEVDFPAAQTCCGQMHYNTGYRDACTPMAEGFATTFTGYDAVVTPSASCAGMIRHYHPLVAPGNDDVTSRVYELSEFLVDVLGVTDVGAYYPHRVTYHPTCHSLRILGVGDRPRKLLEAVRGLDLVELPAADQCCGFGGTFALKNSDVSVAMGADKVSHVRETGAEVLTAADNSCLMHLGGMLSRLRTGVRPVHLAEILASTEEGSMTATYLGMPAFPAAARAALADTQLRRNLGHATATIRAKRAGVVGELDDWEQLRLAGEAIKDRTLRHLDTYLEQLEQQLTERGAIVHWAVDAAAANTIVADVARANGFDEIVKIKSMATQEIGLNEALAADGITAYETDLAELIVQLGDDKPSHILVPAIHRNRSEIREIFRREMPDLPRTLTDEPRELAAAARAHLRRRFLSTPMAVSGANFAVAETGTLTIVESEGNGRMCLTLPEVLVCVVGIEKVVPTWRDLEVFFQLLPRSSTGERMNPYTSTWSGVTPGDGPREVHVVLLDNGRTRALADQVGRQALRCIRCSACLNVCPVYERTGGHAYGSVYPGPIGAILTPLLGGVTGEVENSLPYASTLCGACFEACPVRIDIPSVLLELRADAVKARPHPAQDLTMKLAGRVMRSPRLWSRAVRSAGLAGLVFRRGRIRRLPGPGAAWTDARDAPVPPRESFRAWWDRTRS